MASKGTVHIVYNEHTIRHSLALFLGSSGYAVTCWEGGGAFLEKAKTVVRGCVLLDIRMPQLSGLKLQRALCSSGISLPVIFLADQTDIATAVTAMREGAVDVLEKPFENALLLQALDRGFADIARAGRGQINAREAEALISRLTRREQDVLSGLINGQPNKVIAYGLGISRRTVEVHRAHMMTKLGVHTLPDALRLAFAAGFGAGQCVS